MPVRLRNGILFAAVAAAVLLVDRLTKAHFDSFETGSLLAEPVPGVLGFRLVHNTGGAWGVFGDMTVVLEFLSVAVCAIIVGYLFFVAPDSSPLAAVALGLVFAGGVGNLVDRVSGGYVIDFIEPLFIDFPVFNVADIGVTCGVALFFVALALEWRSHDAGGAPAPASPDGKAEG